ncbi:MAG: alpha-2-macroglobulin [Verrucomicrobiae bacterium]|nr:alpha-2-macroglobulin [Verrucomicrobiae bacterium]
MNIKRRLTFIATLTAILCCNAIPSIAADGIADSLARAERFHAEKSYLRALQIYRSLDAESVPAGRRRFVEFRIHDCEWRAEAVAGKSDRTRLDRARESLERMVNDARRAEERDEVWAEAQESLGDFHWISLHRRNWGLAWRHYSLAMDWWGGARDVDRARGRYMSIVKRIVQPSDLQPHYYYGYYGNNIPLETARDILRIARRDEDLAHANYIMAMTARNGGSAELRVRAADYFEAALKAGKRSPWYDDALWFYAQWMESQGKIVPVEGGGWSHMPDAVKGLELYRRLIREFKQGETRHYRAAQNQIKQITAEQLGVGVGNVFVPGSVIKYHLNWRNVGKVRLALYPLDLGKDLSGSRYAKDNGNWLGALDAGGRPSLKAWDFETEDNGDHQPGRKNLELEGRLAAGAYLLTATAGTKEARDLILVTDSAVVLKTNGRQALAYFCDAVSGEPRAEADVSLWARWREKREFKTRHLTAKTDADGLARFDLSETGSGAPQLFVAARSGERQAFALGNTQIRAGAKSTWKIHVYADRPAYRPGERVEWKVIARTYDGATYETPVGATLRYTITCVTGAKLAEGDLKLNEFGSAWAAQALGAELPLGEYVIRFDAAGRNVGQAPLFRLEEYKLPEFQVKVTTPEENGRKKLFRMGDEVEAEVKAEYHFGGPVANAKVEVIVRQGPHFHHWPMPREFPWLFQDMNVEASRWNRGQPGQEIKRETLTTDADGLAKVRFETPTGGSQDLEFSIEARVTDSSRREIVGSDSVRVTRQRYFVNARSDRHIWSPGDRVIVKLESKDANGHSYPVAGEVTVTRQIWREIWIAPDGKEVFGDALARWQDAGPFPPPAGPGQPSWRRKFSGYEQEEILKRKIQLDAEGAADLDFDPGRDGWYHVNWRSEDVIREEPRLAQAVTADTTVWVASGKTTELGYRSGGIQIIADKDTFRVGEKAAVMLLAPSNRRFVLFSTEGEDLYSHQLVRMNGRVKMLMLDVTEREVPNFYLSASMVMDRAVHQDRQQIVVPPTRNFLTVEVEADKARYQPREKGTFRITTKNDEGKPVPAEVSLGLVDESVFQIQGEYAGDPREFFFGTKRPNHTRDQSSFNWRSYRLIEEEKEEAIALEVNGVEARGVNRMQRGLGFARAAGGVAYSEEMSDAGGMVMPASAPMMMDAAVASGPMEMQMRKSVASSMRGPGGGGGANEVRVHVRNDFRSTVAWMPSVKTGRDGRAEVEVEYPDSLTGWKASVRAVSKGNQFGIATAGTKTKQPLMVRLQAPRFFVAGDDAMISAVINNNTEFAQQVAVNVDFSGLPILVDAANQSVNVAAGSEKRVDWKLRLRAPGELRIRVTGKTRTHGDAMEKTYTVHEHGIEKLVAKSGKVRGESVRVLMDIPAERDVDSTTLTVQVSPSLAVTMLDALPYLISYPYGCTEQTMSRFLPTVITLKTLKDSGLEIEDVAGRLFGGIERANVAKTQPGGRKDMDQATAMVAAGMDRLQDFQRGDGGWGWWKEGDSDHWMSAYVLWGLSVAKELSMDGRDAVLRKAAGFLDQRLVEAERQPDLQAWMLHALAVYRSRVDGAVFTGFQRKAFANLMEQRERLNAYSRALLALAAHHFGQVAEARLLLRNLEDGVVEDKRPDASVLIGGGPRQGGLVGTAHWGGDGFRRWSEGNVETTAFVLKALLAIQPKHRLIEPSVNWLLKNRRGAQWNNTRDTAIVILALNDYLRVTGELQPQLQYELLVNGRSVAKRNIAGADVFKAPTRIEVPREMIRDGRNEIEIRRSGDGPIYFGAEVRFFSREEPITPVGNEIFVKREYHRLVGRPTLLKGTVFDRVTLADGDEVKSGDRIETVLTIEAKNDYEYLLFEDLKPAGFEAVEIRSGGSLHAHEVKEGVPVPKAASRKAARRVVGMIAPPPVPDPPGGEVDDFTGRSRWVYRELRDRKVALFIDKLPQGVWQIRYDLRAEAPGRFHALPVLGQAMYVPEIRCNSAEIRLGVAD